MGTTGVQLARILQQEKHDLVLIDQDKDSYRSAQEHFDAQILLGDAADASTLEPVIDETTDLFIALTENDGANIISTLIARKFGVKRAIAKISNPNNLIHPLLTDDPNVYLLNPEMIVSKDLTRMVGTPSADEVELFAKGKAEMVAMHVAKDAAIIGKKLRDLDVPPTWIVVAVNDKEGFKIASGETVITPDAQIIVVGNTKTYHEMEGFVGLETKKVKRVILVGYNPISKKLCETLSRKGIEIRLIEAREDVAQTAARELDDVLVLSGDGTDQEILDQAGIEDTDYLMALTDDDETNVLISLLAKEQKVGHVVSLAQKSHYNRIIQKVGIDSVLNPRLAMVDEILRCIHHREILGINTLEGGEGRMMEFVVNHKTKIIEKSLSNFKLPEGILIGAIIRNDELIIPRGNTKIKVGDHAVVFSTMAALSEVKKLFGN